MFLNLWEDQHILMSSIVFRNANCSVNWHTLFVADFVRRHVYKGGPSVVTTCHKVINPAHF